MDEIVEKALAKWPNVPHCYGWLGLDARGNWYLRDERTQAGGPFALSRGSLLLNEKLIDFIGRNYAHDAAGQWFFQNGPQRVYVELEVTPLVWRLHEDFSLYTHTGTAASASACLLDEQGRLYLVADAGLGLVHSMDMALAADALEQAHWQAEEVLAADLPARFGYVTSPATLQKQ